MISNSRKENRVISNMKVRSVSLPSYLANVLDISSTGARVQLKGRASDNLVDDRIRFGVMLNGQMSSQFEGFARVAWVRQTENGIEAGLQWEKLTAAAWEKAKGALLLNVAA